MRSKEILVFGGSFNPPHRGHQLMVLEIIKQDLVDGVWFLPVFKHDFEKVLLAASHRLVMLNLMIEDLKKDLKNIDLWQNSKYFLRIEDHEIRDSGLSCTLNTLEALAVQYPQYKFSFLIGSDNLPDFKRWFDRQGRGHGELLGSFKFYVYPRAKFPMAPMYKGMVPLKNVSEMAISSTEVRSLLSKLNHDQNNNQLVKEKLLQVLNPEILKYIMEHCLYQN